MKARAPNLQVQPLTYKTKGNGVSEAETSTPKGNLLLMQLARQESHRSSEYCTKVSECYRCNIKNRTKMILDPEGEKRSDVAIVEQNFYCAQRN